MKETVSAGGTAYGVAQYSYDSDGRLDCTALRMNSATWSSLPGACTPATTGAAGPDRINRNSYDAADQLTKVQSAYGTADQADEAVLTYTSNGKLATATDAEANKTTYEYDGVDRLRKTRFPNGTQGSATSSTTDYEELTYDAGSNVTSRRLRDGTSIGYTYDNLGRVTAKDRPNVAWSEGDIAYAYDLFARPVSATDSNGRWVTIGYDALGRKTSEASSWGGTMSSAYDLAGRRTSLTWPDSFYVNYDHLVTGEVSAVRENGATSGVGVLATYSYDNLGRRTGIARGNGTSTSYSYDSVSRLSSLGQNMASTGYDFTHGFTYNPASQIASLTKSNDSYAWGGHANVNRNYSVNGLNQATAAGSTSLSHDGRGNTSAIGSSSYSYTADNQLATSPGSNYGYDPLGRLFHESAPNSALAYDGSELVLERDASTSAVRRRYVHGPGADEPLVWYEGSGTGDRRWLHTDERGSIVAVSNASGTVTNVNTYNEYGVPGAGNVGRFQYTGQAWLPELGMYYYKARIYNPTLGRFMQTDPIGYGDGMNWYNYVGSDPVNGVDPTGTKIPTYCTGSIIPAGDAGCGGGVSNLATYGGSWVCLDCKEQGQSDGPGGVIVRKPTWVFRADQDSGIVLSRRNFILEAFFNQIEMVREAVRETICSAPPLNIGFGVDAYAGIGGSLGAQLQFDPSRGIGISANGAVGVGLGYDVGPNAGSSFSNIGPAFGRNLGSNGPISANLTTSTGGGMGMVGNVTSSVIGTNAGQVEASAGRGGASGYVNGGASAGVNIPIDIGCG